MCGEHDVAVIDAHGDAGSSPRVWGALHAACENPHPLRLIPTCVGSTERLRVVFCEVAAHPHVCGEHFKDSVDCGECAGSSPRVWGALLSPPMMWWTTLAHPHVCGEHGRVVYWGDQKSGSSPRVWGAHHSRKYRKRTRRLIPTCVGSTSPNAYHAQEGLAHPHVCGEHSPQARHIARVTGSSPRVWGAQLVREMPLLDVRLIPTCVGSTSAPENPHTAD